MTSTVVVGAGIAGLTFAIAARRHGHDVVVREERPELGGGAGHVLRPAAFAALDRIGLGDGVRDLSAPLGDGSSRGIARSDLQLHLADLLGTEAIRLGSPVVMPHGDLVVGADGYRSVVARRLDPTIRERHADRVVWRGIAPVAIDGADGRVRRTPDGESGLVPLPGGRTAWFVVRLGRTEGVPPTLGHSEAVAEVVAATPEDRVSCLPVTDRDVPATWYRDGMVLIGDAAHAMRPGLGEAAGLAIEDGVLLAECLGSGPADPDALAAWATERREHIAPLVAAAATGGRVLDLQLVE